MKAAAISVWEFTPCSRCLLYTSFFDDGVPNEVGPFYACRLWPRVHHCMGGLDINNEAQVIDARGKVIPNLYAAGEATGGVHGMVRLGTVAVAARTIFGLSLIHI